jgi:hypothetical protein
MSSPVWQIGVDTMKLSFHLPRRCWCWALLCGVLPVAPAAGAAAQGNNHSSARDVHLRIETDRPTYHVGDSIAVRLTLRNVSAAAVRYVSDPPVVQARLRVYDAAGQLVEPSLPRPLLHSSARPVTLKAGESVTLSWQKHEWLNLRDRGYDLRTPGRFTIAGLPGVFGPELAPDYETVRSNKATFTIFP